jgi:hypothetical protein
MQPADPANRASRNDPGGLSKRGRSRTCQTGILSLASRLAGGRDMAHRSCTLHSKIRARAIAAQEMNLGFPCGFRRRPVYIGGQTCLNAVKVSERHRRILNRQRSLSATYIDISNDVLLSRFMAVIDAMR